MAKRFLSNINVNDQYTLPSADGTSGQVIQTDGSGNLSFVDFASNEARKIIFTVKNKDSISLSKGTVVHASPSANPPSGNIIEVIRADNDDSSKMPAIGVLNETLAVDAEGECVMLGSVSGIATNSFAVGDELYVSNTPGEFTNTKPTGTSNLIQKIGIVIKSHSTNGLIEVFGAGRSNDVPNLVDRTITFDSFVDVAEYIRHKGDNNTYIRFLDDRLDFRAGNLSFIDLREQTDSKLHINVSNNDIDFQVRGTTNNNLIRTDAANDKVGIGNTPNYAFDVHLGTNNAMRVNSTDDTAQIIMSDDDTTAFIGVRNSTMYMSFTSGTQTDGFYIDSSGNGTFAGDVTTSGHYFADTHFRSTDGNVTLSATGDGGVYLRPDGYNQSSSQVFIAANGGDATFSGNITLPDNIFVGQSNSTDNYIKVFHDDNKYTEIHGYGIITDRTSYYIRPHFDGTQTLYIGNADANKDWNSVQVKYNTDVDFVKNGSTIMTITDNVGIGTDSPSAKLDIVNSGLSTQLRLSNTTSDATTKYGVITGRHYTNSEENVTGMLITSSSSVTGGAVSIGGGVSNANAVNEIKFYTAANNTTLAGSERMRITSGGRVGIGTTNPTTYFHVNSGAENAVSIFESTDATAKVCIKDNSSTNYYSVAIGAVGDELTLYSGTGGTERVRIDSIGRVGINETNPGYKLDVHNGTVGEGIARFSGADSDDMIFVTENGYMAIDTRNTATGLSFQMQGSDKVRILPSGNVGIGTDSPSVQLDIEDSSNVIVDMNTTTANANTTIRFQESGTVKATVGYDGTNDGLILTTGGFTAGNGIFIDDSQNVGIGTDSPNYKLDVNGSLRGASNVYAVSTYAVVLDSNSGAGPQITFGSTSNFAQYGRIAQHSSKFQFITQSRNFEWLNGSTSLMTLQTGGNVGIGLTNPSEKLDVNGDIRLTGAGPVIIMNSENAASGGRINVTGLNGDDDDLLRIQDSGTTRFEIHRDGDLANNLIPHTDSTYDLGSSTQRWANLYVDNIIGPGGDNSEEIARIVGWVEAYSNVNADTVRWNYTEDAMELQSNGDASIGAAFKAVRVKKDQTVRFTTMIKGSAASSTGAYLRLYQHDGDMPDGKTHVSHNATTSAAVVQEDDSAVINWHENGAITTDWVTFEYDFTPSADGYVSLVVLNWSDFGTNSLYVKTPDIQTNIAGDKITLTQDDAADGYKLVRSGHDSYRMTLNNSKGLHVVNDTDSRTEMAFRGNGTVSIGTTSADADARFHLSGPSTSPSLSGTTPTSYTAIFSNSDTAYGTLFATQGNGNGLIQQRRTNTDTFYNLSLQPHGGNVGIGLVGPAHLLHVQGDATDGVLVVSRTSNTDQKLFLRGGAGSGEGRVASNYHLELKSGLSGSNAYDLSLSTHTGVALRVDATNNNVGIGTTSPSEKLHVNGDSHFDGRIGINMAPDSAYQLATYYQQTNPDDDYRFAHYINADFSGADNTTHDREQGGIYLDLDSSADGDATDEHRYYGIYLDQRFTGFSDLAYGMFARLETNNTTEKTNILRAIYGLAIADNSNVNGGVSTLSAGHFDSYIEDMGDVDVAYGSFNRTYVQSTRTANVGTAIGLHAEVEINSPNAINYGDMFAVRAQIDNNEGSAPTFANQYLYYGAYLGTKGSNAYGLYITDEDKNYISSKLGIGTTTPTAPLHIEGATNSEVLKVEADADPYIRWVENGTNVGFLQFTGSTAYLSNMANGSFQFRTNNTTKMLITSGGNVGIGATSPDSKLTINGGINNVWSYSTETTDQPGFVAANNTNFSTQTNLLYAKIYGSGITASGFGITSLGNYAVVATDGSNNNGLLLGTFTAKPLIIGTANTERIRITPTGEVGIGVTVPSGKLHVDGIITTDARSSRDKIRVWSNGTYAIGMRNNMTYGAINSDYAMTFQMSNTVERGFWWGDSSHTDAQGAMSLSTTGVATIATSLSIGEGQSETSPQTDTLFVSGSARLSRSVGDTVLTIEADTDNNAENDNPRLELKQDGGAVYTHVGINGNAGDTFTGAIANYGYLRGSVGLHFVVNGIAMSINNSNHVSINQRLGIGTTAPAYKLDVNGTIRATGDVIAYSDERVKENIKTIDNSLEKVNQLRGVEFNKIGEDKKSIGVIAQEIEKVLPEVVSTDDDGMKSVAYGNITGVLIEAIKELKQEIETLKTQINK